MPLPPIFYSMGTCCMPFLNDLDRYGRKYQSRVLVGDLCLKRKGVLGMWSANSQGQFVALKFVILGTLLSWIFSGGVKNVWCTGLPMELCSHSSLPLPRSCAVQALVNAAEKGVSSLYRLCEEYWRSWQDGLFYTEVFLARWLVLDWSFLSFVFTEIMSKLWGERAWSCSELKWCNSY